jgi:hypothetical protein
MVLLCGKDSKGFGGMLPLFFVYLVYINQAYIQYFVYIYYSSSTTLNLLIASAR